ncbi:carbonic anhydrase family protein [Candidatus Thiothrix sp. Deng01]|uniref:Carbonic anhydrase n=1 Tax=Candidatus Thiothrix phosphatis TaxID=3112415 RepID=A0ABU6CXR5_9GAMM|nr:carbonic anhydrase family protein [Candidatus Thiothrix sp. Deng01]MEB4591624.1 carbonic anhydrase family protein [Candidatus Thiothrix sp. Deng01]
MKTWFATGILLLSTGCASVHDNKPPHWTYEGAEGPEHWGELADAYKACATGKNQSPVNLDNQHAVAAKLPPLQLAYGAGGYEELNNGHTIQVNYQPGGSLTLDGHRYGLKQFHFHAPSENQIDGKTYPLEAHLVHADQDNNLAVIAIMFTESAQDNPNLEPFWSQMPTHPDEKTALMPLVDVAKLLPAKRDYYRFSGSLTTPPCSEGVVWLVMKQPVNASKTQIEKFTQIMGHPNNRPIQPVNARPLLK